METSSRDASHSAWRIMRSIAHRRGRTSARRPRERAATGSSNDGRTSFFHTSKEQIDSGFPSEMHAALLRICAGLTLLFSRDFQMTAIAAQHLSMNGAHKMIILDHRREMDGLVDLKIARRGQLEVCEFLRESLNVTSMVNPIRFHKCAWILLRTILQSCNDSMIKQQVCLCSKVLVMVQESVRFLR